MFAMQEMRQSPRYKGRPMMPENILAHQTQEVGDPTPGLLISAMALLFTVTSFWWIQVRRGRLICSEPRTYAAAFEPKRILIVLPLVLYNSGPAPIVLTDFRLWITRSDERLLCRWRATQPGISPAAPGGGRVFPSPFPVEGRRAIERFIEFGRSSTEIDPAQGPYKVEVEVKKSHSSKWKSLLSFELNTQLSTAKPSEFRVRPNDPEWEDS